MQLNEGECEVLKWKETIQHLTTHELLTEGKSVR